MMRMLTRRTMLALPALVALPGAAPALPPGVPLRLRWMVPAGEHVTRGDAHQYRSCLYDALRYWYAYAPDYPAPYVVKEDTLRYDDPFSSWRWLYQQEDRAYQTLVVIVNRASRRLVDLGGGYLAPGYALQRAAYVCTHTSDDYGSAADEDALGYLAAHELGHLVYGLPDASAPMMTGTYREVWRQWSKLCF